MRSRNLLLSCFYLSLALTAASPHTKNLLRDLSAQPPQNTILHPRGQCLGCAKGQPPPADTSRTSGLPIPDRLEPSPHGAGGSQGSAGSSSHRRPSLDRGSLNQPQVAPNQPRPELATDQPQQPADQPPQLARESLYVEPEKLSDGSSETAPMRPYTVPPRTGSRGSYRVMGFRPRPQPEYKSVPAGQGETFADARPSSPLDRSGSGAIGRQSTEKSVSFASVGEYPGTPQLGRDSLESGSVRSSSRKLQPLFEAFSGSPSPGSPRGGSRPPLDHVDSPGSGNFMAERWARIQARKGQASPGAAGGSAGSTASRSPPPGSNRALAEAQLDRSTSDRETGSPRGGTNSPPPAPRRQSYGHSASSAPGSLGSQSNNPQAGPAGRLARVDSTADSERAPLRRTQSAGKLSPPRLQIVQLPQGPNPRNPPNPTSPRPPPQNPNPNPPPANTPDSHLRPRGLTFSKSPKNLPEHATPAVCFGPRKRFCERKCYCSALAEVFCDLPTTKTEKMSPNARMVGFLAVKEQCAPACQCEYNAQWLTGRLTPAERRALEGARAEARGGATVVGVPAVGSGSGAGDAGAGPSGDGEGGRSGARKYGHRLFHPGPQSRADSARLVPRTPAPVFG